MRILEPISAAVFGLCAVAATWALGETIRAALEISSQGAW